MWLTYKAKIYWLINELHDFYVVIIDNNILSMIHLNLKKTEIQIALD